MTSKLSLGLFALPFVPSSIVQGQGQEVRNERPNIIFIMSDDHARQAMSIYGHPIGKVAPTPNIDRIGHEGAVFQNNYCCNSISGLYRNNSRQGSPVFKIKAAPYPIPVVRGSRVLQ